MVVRSDITYISQTLSLDCKPLRLMGNGVCYKAAKIHKPGIVQDVGFFL